MKTHKADQEKETSSNFPQDYPVGSKNHRLREDWDVFTARPDFPVQSLMGDLSSLRTGRSELSSFCKIFERQGDGGQKRPWSNFKESFALGGALP
jgi:hypothetical protein